jgi:hypothetical protein
VNGKPWDAVGGVCWLVDGGRAGIVVLVVSWLAVGGVEWCFVQKGGMPMQNVVFQMQGNQLVIVVDLSQELGLSQSQKSMLIASTGGNVAVPGYEDIKVGLNVYRPVQTGNGVRR